MIDNEATTALITALRSKDPAVMEYAITIVAPHFLGTKDRRNKASIAAALLDVSIAAIDLSPPTRVKALSIYIDGYIQDPAARVSELNRLRIHLFSIAANRRELLGPSAVRGLIKLKLGYPKMDRAVFNNLYELSKGPPAHDVTLLAHNAIRKTFGLSWRPRLAAKQLQAFLLD